MSERTNDFLIRHRLSPELTDPVREAPLMAEDMRAGLAGQKSSMPMIPTYLSNDGVVPKNRWAAIIDAGGTNFRRALVCFTDDGCQVEEMKKTLMPGRDEPCTWEQFISYTADMVEPLMDRTDIIGYCFSFSADITPDMDGIVHAIDKEVVVTGCEGKHIGACLTRELSRRGYPGKKVVILNDTVAVLLGGAATVDKNGFSGFVGQVSGTGTNTCVSVPRRDIGKLGMDGSQGMIVNAESGMYTGIQGGDFDRRLDEESQIPGCKHFEKLTSGAYLGDLCVMALECAVQEGLLSPECGKRIKNMQDVHGGHLDLWSRGLELDMFCCTPEDGRFAVELSQAILKRSARCMCTNLLAMALLTGSGRSGDRPMLDVAEGSLVQKCRVYRDELLRLLSECGAELGIRIELVLGDETTVSGAAAAALLNC